ncbi:MAG: serpin family protein [Planctomycetota bacterium]|jgi:serpin B
MSTRRATLVALTLPTLLAACDTTSPWPDDPDPARWAAFADDVPALVAGNERFAIDLFRQASAGREDNLFCAPASVSAALSMALAGARGTTAEQMEAVMHAPLGPDRLHGAWASLIRTLVAGSGDGWQLRIANRMWGRAGDAFRPEYLQLTREEYAAELAAADFVGDAEGARGAINDWVGRQTAGRIPTLLAPGVLGPSTRLVIVNAVWFKGDWEEPFDVRFTRQEPFLRAGAPPVDVPLMALGGERFRYAEDDDVQVLELPYEGRAWSMIVVLPRAADGLAAVEAALSAERLAGWIDGLRTTDVNVWLPRFELRTQIELSEALKALGMSSAFELAAADFTGIAPSGELFLGAVVHEAWVKVDETGTEAAAATAVAGVDSAAPQQPRDFRADHPFLALIRDGRTGTILFMGRVADPS